MHNIESKADVSHVTSLHPFRTADELTYQSFLVANGDEGGETMLAAERSSHVTDQFKLRTINT